MKVPVRLLLLLLVVTPAIAQTDPRFAFAVPGGTVWAGGGNNAVTFAPNGGPARTLWNAPDGINLAAWTGKRLLLSGPNALHTLTPGTWQSTTTETEAYIDALAAGLNIAVAFDHAGNVWQLAPDGRWIAHPSGLGPYDSVASLAYGAGVWVAVGSDRWGYRTDENGEEMNPSATWYPTSRIWWSQDGLKWDPVNLPGQDDGGTSRLVAVTYGAPGFLAISQAGEVFVSRDGRTWQAGHAPDGFASETVVLRALGDSFWLQPEKYDEPAPLYRSQDGHTWESVPLADDGARRAALFIQDGEVRAVGLRKKGRALEIAAITAFGEAPQPNATELAAAEKLRRETEAKQLAEKRTAEAKAIAQKKAEREAAAAKALAAKEAEEKRLQPAAAALAQFEQTVLNTPQIDRLGEPFGQLIKALDAAGATQLADAVAAYATDFLFRSGGVRGYFDYMMTVPEKHLRSAMARLEAPHKPLIKVFAAAHRPGQGVANTPEVRQAEAAWPPATRAADSTGPQQPKTDGYFDLARMRLAVLHGHTGATHDLGMIYYQGYGARKDRVLASVWLGIFNRFHPGKPDPKQGAEVVDAFLIQAGVPSSVAQAAQDAFKANHYRYTDEIFSALERSSEDGDLIAPQYLAATPDTLALHRAGMSFEQIYGYSADFFAHFEANTQNLSADQLLGYLDQRVAYTARAMTADTSQGGDSAVGQAYNQYLAANDKAREQMYADLAAKDAAASKPSDKKPTMTIAGKKIDLAAQIQQAGDDYAHQLDADIASGKTTATQVASNAADFSAKNTQLLAAAQSNSSGISDDEVNGTGGDKVDYGAMLKADGMTDAQLKKLDQSVNKGVAGATPGRAARLVNFNRNHIEAKLRGRLLRAERNEPLSAAEITELTQSWHQLGAPTAPRDFVVKNFFGLHRATLTVPGLTGRADIAPLIRQAYVNCLGFDLPAAADPAALCATTEAALAEVAAAARAAAPAEVMPALYLAAAERARFPLLAGSLRLASEKTPWDYARTVEQLGESADLMERWNGSSRAAHTTRIKLPAVLESARSWPGWSELNAAAASGRTVDLIHWLNELSLALRAEALRRDPQARLPLPESLKSILLPTSASR